MIKCNVTVCGTVCRQAQMRANKEGKQFISFGISVVVQAKTGINKTVEISEPRMVTTRQNWSTIH